LSRLFWRSSSCPLARAQLSPVHPRIRTRFVSTAHAFLLLPPQQELVVFIIIDCIGKRKELIADWLPSAWNVVLIFFPRLVSPFPCRCLSVLNYKMWGEIVVRCSWPCRPKKSQKSIQFRVQSATLSKRHYR
jgi:hypothetical protein